ncbi:hypothetical protein AADZ91_08865 [Colwelliaceae bacterium 6441]
MITVYKNVFLLLLGSAFINLFVWLSSVVSATPVPEFLRPYPEFVLSYYPNILIILLAAILALSIMLVVRKVFTSFNKQNLFYFSLPIVLFLAFLLTFFNFAIVPVFYAAIPTLLVATTLTISEKNTVKNI